MTDQVEKTTEAVKPLIDKLGEYLAAAEKIVVERAPDVWDATLTIIQLRAIASLVGLALFTGVTIWAFRKAIHFARIEHKKEWTQRADLLAFFAPAGCAIASVIVAVLWATSFEQWLGAFAPEYAVLYGIATKLGIL